MNTVVNIRFHDSGQLCDYDSHLLKQGFANCGKSDTIQCYESTVRKNQRIKNEE